MNMELIEFDRSYLRQDIESVYSPLQTIIHESDMKISHTNNPRQPNDLASTIRWIGAESDCITSKHTLANNVAGLGSSTRRFQLTSNSASATPRKQVITPKRSVCSATNSPSEKRLNRSRSNLSQNATGSSTKPDKTDSKLSFNMFPADDLFEFSMCDRCSKLCPLSLDLWMDHLGQVHPIPLCWPSSKVDRLNEQERKRPYTSVVGANKKRKGCAVPRPLNSFMIFAQYLRRIVLHWFPDAPNVHISQRVGQLWRQLDVQMRDKYVIEAYRLQQLHSVEFPHYKYQPKKRIRNEDSDLLSNYSGGSSSLTTTHCGSSNNNINNGGGGGGGNGNNFKDQSKSTDHHGNKKLNEKKVLLIKNRIESAHFVDKPALFTNKNQTAGTNRVTVCNYSNSNNVYKKNTSQFQLKTNYSPVIEDDYQLSNEDDDEDGNHNNATNHNTTTFSTTTITNNGNTTNTNTTNNNNSNNQHQHQGNNGGLLRESTNVRIIDESDETLTLLVSGDGGQEEQFVNQYTQQLNFKKEEHLEHLTINSNTGHLSMPDSNKAISSDRDQMKMGLIRPNHNHQLHLNNHQLHSPSGLHQMESTMHFNSLTPSLSSISPVSMDNLDSLSHSTQPGEYDSELNGLPDHISSLIKVISDKHVPTSIIDFSPTSTSTINDNNNINNNNNNNNNRNNVVSTVIITSGAAATGAKQTYSNDYIITQDLDDSILSFNDIDTCKSGTSLDDLDQMYLFASTGMILPSSISVPNSSAPLPLKSEQAIINNESSLTNPLPSIESWTFDR